MLTGARKIESLEIIPFSGTFGINVGIFSLKRSRFELFQLLVLSNHCKNAFHIAKPACF